MKKIEKAELKDNKLNIIFTSAEALDEINKLRTRDNQAENNRQELEQRIEDLHQTVIESKDKDKNFSNECETLKKLADNQNERSNPKNNLDELLKSNPELKIDKCGNYGYRVCAPANNKFLRSYGLYDLEGNEILPIKYTAINFCKNGLLVAIYCDEYWYFSEFGEISVSDWDLRKEKRRSIKFGFFDYNGKEIVPCEFIDLADKQNGIIVTKMNYSENPNKCGPLKGYNNYNGEKILPCRYSEVVEGKYGIYAQILDCCSSKIIKKWGYYDYSGREILPCEYSTIYETKNGIVVENILGTDNYQSAYYDFLGNEIIPFGNYEIAEYKNGLLIKETSKNMLGKEKPIFIYCNFAGEVLAKDSDIDRLKGKVDNLYLSKNYKRKTK